MAEFKIYSRFNFTYLRIVKKYCPRLLTQYKYFQQISQENIILQFSCLQRILSELSIRQAVLQTFDDRQSVLYQRKYVCMYASTGRTD